MSICIVGAQWGDEGKGKIVHFLASEYDIVARYGGGDNAGHTVVFDGKQFKLHLIPSGIFYENVKCILGSGMVINPKNLLVELEALEKSSVTTNNLWISDGAHVIMPYHCWLDEMEEKERQGNSIGTTGRGIGPAYQDKVARRGIRIFDLLEPEILREKLICNLKIKSVNLPDKNIVNLADNILEEYLSYGKALAGRITDTSILLNKLIRNGKSAIFEGAQGVLLDLDFGTYPYVTASHPIAGGVSIGLGVPPSNVNSVLAVLKAYTTRVGNGAFPTELHGEQGNFLREKGHEYGTTTGRPRRCGWLDMVMLKYGAILNGYTELAITKLDVLSNINPLKICTAYKLDGKVVHELPPYHNKLSKCEPVYEELPGWSEEISGVREYNKLPGNAKRYLNKISEQLEAPISIISVGPSHEETIRLS